MSGFSVDRTAMGETRVYDANGKAVARHVRADLAGVFAAAPDLLAAAVIALEFATPKSGLADKLRAAIAKATGGDL